MAENNIKPIKEEWSQMTFQMLNNDINDEYADFLAEAYSDQFNSYKFNDRDAIKKRWRWEYIDNPAAVDKKPLIWLCRIDGKIAGQLCVMPVYLKSGASIYKGGWFQDFIVLKEYRKQGIGYSLTKHVIEDLQGALDCIMVAGTNERSYKLFKGLGFLDMGLINRNVMPMNFNRISEKLFTNRQVASMTQMVLKGLYAIMRSFSFGSSKTDIHIVSVGESKDEFDALWMRISNEFPCMIRRDRAFLQWRFFDNPEIKYEILIARNRDVIKGYAALRESTIRTGRLKGLVTGVVSDIFFDPREKGTGEVLIGASIDRFKDKVAIVRCDITDSRLRGAVEAMGFLRISSNNRFLILNTNKNMDASAKVILQDPKNWLLTYGDSDLDFL